MIDSANNFIYIQIPKTATSSICDSLSNGRKIFPIGWDKVHKLYRQHFTINEYIEYEYIPTNYREKYYTFTFVRNPYDRLVSEFFWRKNLHKDFAEITFDDFVKCSWDEDTQRKCSIRQHIRSMSDYVYDGDKCCVDYVGRYENLQDDFNIICDNIGVARSQLKCKNSNFHHDYRCYYNSELYHIVTTKYATDLKNFDYAF